MKIIKISGTTLFHIAASEYGDATQWWRIAKQNNIVDPVLSGVTTLTIPDADSSTTGDGIPFDQ